MTLTPMRYKSYTWPHNPRVYSIDFHRTMAVNQTPFNGYQLQDLGLSQRVMEGVGEFVGEGAYAEFQKLACVFYESGPGLLVHPLWQAANTYFVALRLEQAPRPDYVRYSFTFWEESSHYNGMATRVVEVSSAQETAAAGGQTTQQQTTGLPAWWPSADLVWNAVWDPEWPEAVQIPFQPVTPVSVSADPAYHSVVKGDTLWALSQRYGTDLSELIALNPQIKNPNLIIVGQEVRVR